MSRKPSPALMRALRNFAFRHEIFVEAREFDYGFIFTRLPRPGSRRKTARRHFELLLRRGGRRVKFFSLTCGSDDEQRSQVAIDFPEKVLLMPSEAAIEYEACGRDLRRYAASFSNDADAARALFGYVRSESRLLVSLLGDASYRELLRLVRRHSRPMRRTRMDRRPKTHGRGRP